MLQELTSRKNATIVRLRALAADGAFRRAEGEYLCDGEKLLLEALGKGAQLRCVLWKERAGELPGLADVPQFVAPAELFDYASPMKNSPGPLFTLAIPQLCPLALGISTKPSLSRLPHPRWLPT